MLGHLLNSFLLYEVLDCLPDALFCDHVAQVCILEVLGYSRIGVSSWLAQKNMLGQARKSVGCSPRRPTALSLRGEEEANPSPFKSRSI